MNKNVLPAHHQQKIAARAYTAAAVFAACALAIALVSAAALLARRIGLERSWDRLKNAYPSLVFQRVAFSKYLVQGTIPETEAHFAKLDIYLVRGSADIRFDLSPFAIDKRATDWINRVLVLECARSSEAFLSDVDVFIEPDGITLVESVAPREYTTEEMDSLKQKAALVTGAAGAGAGALAGSILDQGSKSIFSRFPVIGYSGGLSTLVGAAAGGTLAAGTAYLFTDNFIAALQGSAQKPAQQAELLHAAIPLIAREIRGDTAEKRDDLEQYYRVRFEKRMGAIAREFGWKGLVIEYGDAP